MDHKVLLIFLLCETLVVESFHDVIYEYYFINLGMTWTNAQQYCRKHYTDLATFRSTLDLNKLNIEVYFSYAWIGLFDNPASWKGVMGSDLNSWRWSATGTFSPGGYQNWAPGDPDYRGGVEECVSIQDGEWHDINCGYLCIFVCFTGGTDPGSKIFTLVETALSWGDARTHCRQYYTDLALIADESENTMVASLISDPNASAWIGLYRHPWRWSDDYAYNRTSFSNWDSRQPSNSYNNEPCAVLNSRRLWHDGQCYSLFPFICHKAMEKRLTAERITLQTSAVLLSSENSAQILQQFTKRLMEKGLTDFELKWMTSPRREHMFINEPRICPPSNLDAPTH